MDEGLFHLWSDVRYADLHGIYSMVIHDTKCLPCETT